MKPMIVFALLLIAGQAYAAEQIISVQHDSHRGVTCWIVNNTGISCLPDSSLQPQVAATPSGEAGRAYPPISASEDRSLVAGKNQLPPKGTTTVESEAMRASKADYMRQNEQLTTTSRPPQKGLQL